MEEDRIMQAMWWQKVPLWELVTLTLKNRLIAQKVVGYDKCHFPKGCYIRYQEKNKENQRRVSDGSQTEEPESNIKKSVHVELLLSEEETSLLLELFKLSQVSRLLIKNAFYMGLENPLSIPRRQRKQTFF